MAWELVLRHPDAEESALSSVDLQRIFSSDRQCSPVLAGALFAPSAAFPRGSPRGLGGVNRGSAVLEADFDILAMGGVDLPEVPVGKIENPRDDDIRELL